ncbi:MAG: S8 family serine peptidase [Planctomycetota bacterium]
MNTLAGRTALCAVLLAAVATTQDAERAVPGRWIVTLQSRGFDLEAYRQAIASDVSVTAMDDVLADLDARMHADQAPIVEAVETLGGRVVAQWWIVNGMAIELPAAQVDQLRKIPRIASVSADEVRSPGIKTSTNAANHATDLVQAAGIRGDGVTIAFIDSGVDENMAGAGHPHTTFYVDGDLANHAGGGLAGSRLLTNVQLGRVSPDDLIDHGTAVAGIAAGARWNSTDGTDDGHAPRATIASYCVADDALGNTTSSILTSAWQRVAIDRVRLAIRVANCSYEGSFATTRTDQVAIDVLAYIADMTITGMAGNGGASGTAGYGATNMLAVGACFHDSRIVAAFSQRGPTPTNPPRTYPDLIANGVALLVPSADVLTSRFVQGTSFSCAQVAGGAALYREVRPAANAMEVRAAILASTEDVLDRQIGVDRHRNAIGHGYLRVDRLVDAAQHAAITTTAVATAVGQPLRFPLAVRAGGDYSIAIAWFRDASAGALTPPWSDLDLALYDGSTLLTRQATAGNLDEVLRWHANAAAQLTVEVVPIRLQAGAPQPFALVAMSVADLAGSLTSFGSTCNTSGYRPPGLTTYGSPLPQVGHEYWIDCWPTGPSFQAPLVLMLGASSTSYGAAPLPLDLTPFGAPSCFLRVSPDVILPVPSSQWSYARMLFQVPAQRSLIGRHLFHQAAMLDPRVNGLGALFSNGIDARIGGVR